MSSRRRSALWAAGLTSLIGAYLALYIASAAYCLIFSIGQRYAIGIVAGAIMLQDREPPGVIRPIIPALASGSVLNPAPRAQPFKHRALDIYRHNFGFTW